MSQNPGQGRGRETVRVGVHTSISNRVDVVEYVKYGTRANIGNTYDNNKISHPSGRSLLVSQPFVCFLLEKLARTTYKAPPPAAPPQPA